ncbi:hypothetical protein ACA910_015285 [Epithemia clementina (nom. ined.)]
MHVLGIKAEPVCDHPLAVMDASTLQPQHGRSNRIFIDLHVHTVTNLKGEISHGPDQKRYYYPDQTANEVLVFSHYHKNQKGCGRQHQHQHRLGNPHGRFQNPYCPDSHR